MFNALDGLNDEQKEAVMTTEGYVRVIAGAGSGKTGALTRRYAHLVNDLGISTNNILCVTFTNKAANEMKGRIRSMIGNKDLSLICTFHGFCVQVLREDVARISYPKNFLILDEEDTEDILKNVYQDSNIKATTITFKEARKLVHDYKKNNQDGYISDFLARTSEAELFQKYKSASTTDEKIIFGYLYEQRKNYGLDYNDLIYVTLYVFRHFPEVLQKWQERLQYVMVDEFQDVNVNQIRLLQVSDFHKNLFVVGDPDQTIYSWRGARVEFIMNFVDIYPEAKTIIMNKNYRSSPSVLSVANSLINKNTNRVKKQLIPIKRPDNTMTIYNHAKTTKDEATWITDRIKTLRKYDTPMSDILILYRAHYVSRSIEEALMREGIPYEIHSGISFYARKEIKDSISYLRMLISGDDLSFSRTVNEPRRNIGKTRMQFLKKYSEDHHCSLLDALRANLDTEMFRATGAKTYLDLLDKFRKTYKEKTLTNLFKELLDEAGYEEMLRVQGEDERLENIAELKQSMTEYENTAGEDISLEDYLSKIALYTNTDKVSKKSTVKLMTIHSAKGLEFPYVFVCGMNEGIFPSSRITTLPELEEERRLAYVAFTRAKNALFLTDAEGYNFNRGFRFPSRFILEIDKRTLSYITELEESLKQNATLFIEESVKSMEERKNNSGLQGGDTIEHEQFGRGEVLEVDYLKDSVKIKFDSMETPRSISMTKQLKKIDVAGVDNTDNTDNTDNSLEEDGKKVKKGLLSRLFSIK